MIQKFKRFYKFGAVTISLNDKIAFGLRMRVYPYAYVYFIMVHFTYMDYFIKKSVHT